MNTHFVSTTMSVIEFVVGIIIMIFVSRIYVPKFSKEENNQSFDKMFVKNKVSAIILAFLLVLMNLFKLFLPDVKENINWENGDKEMVISKLIEANNETYKEYPNTTMYYAECSANVIMKSMNKLHFKELLIKPHSIQKIELDSLLKDCNFEFQKNVIDSNFKMINSKRNIK